MVPTCRVLACGLQRTSPLLLLHACLACRVRVPTLSAARRGLMVRAAAGTETSISSKCTAGAATTGTIQGVCRKVRVHTGQEASMRPRRGEPLPSPPLAPHVFPSCAFPRACSWRRAASGGARGECAATNLSVCGRAYVDLGACFGSSPQQHVRTHVWRRAARRRSRRDDGLRARSAAAPNDDASPNATVPPHGRG